MNPEKLTALLKEIASKIQPDPTHDAAADFNIFCVLGVEAKEVIICRLLRELLDPFGSHNLGHKGLLQFVRGVLGVADFSENDAKHSKVETEEVIDNARRVDVVIHTPKGIIPIEVKIWAEDQAIQLSDYYFHYQKKNQKLLNGKIYYLTPTGRDPSENSRGKLSIGKEIGLLSFIKDVRAWLNDYPCDTPGEMVGLCIKQFIEVIDMMESSEKELQKLIQCLCDDAAWDVEKSSAALMLLKYEKEIRREILKKYLKRAVEFGEGITVVDCLKEDQAVDAHALVRLVKNGEAFACVCVDTNLYMFCKKKNDEEQIDGWIDYENGQYRWKYICPTDYSKVKYPIKDKLPLQKKIAIDLTAVLEDITEEL